MELYCRHQRISSLEEWRRCIRKSQWKAGRSAQSLAEFVCGQSSSATAGEQRLKQIVSGMTGLDDIVLEECEIEHASHFDGYGSCRHHDLGLFGHADGKSLFVGVEAKVVESFGPTVAAKFKNGMKIRSSGGSTNIPERLKWLLDRYFDGAAPEDARVGGLRYQLLHYLAGSVCEEAAVIAMPVLVFRTKHYTDNLQTAAKNEADYRAFMTAAHFEQQTVNNGLTVFHRRIDGRDVYSCYMTIDEAD